MSTDFESSKEDTGPGQGKIGWTSAVCRESDRSASIGQSYLCQHQAELL